MRPTRKPPMLHSPEFKRSDYGNLALTRLLVWPTLLICLALVNPIMAQPAPSAVTIPGALKVDIQPPEATAAGALWSIDGGAAQLSGVSITNLAARTHAIQFSKIQGWQEPAMTEVLVIGGKQAIVTAIYRPM